MFNKSSAPLKKSMMFQSRKKLQPHMILLFINFVVEKLMQFNAAAIFGKMMHWLGNSLGILPQIIFKC